LVMPGLLCVRSVVVWSVRAVSVVMVLSLVLLTRIPRGSHHTVNEIGSFYLTGIAQNNKDTNGHSYEMAGDGGVFTRVSGLRPDLKSTAVKRAKGKQTMSFETGSVTDFVRGRMEIFASGQVKDVGTGSVTDFVRGRMEIFASGQVKDVGMGSVMDFVRGKMEIFAGGKVENIANGKTVDIMMGKMVRGIVSGESADCQRGVSR
jgi:hypothetical protein